MIFGLDPIDESVWNGGVGGHNKYSMLNNFGTTGEMISESLEDVDKLKRKIELQRESLDMIFEMARAKENRLASIPSIKPVVEDKLKRKRIAILVSFLIGFILNYSRIIFFSMLEAFKDNEII